MAAQLFMDDWKVAVFTKQVKGFLGAPCYTSYSYSLSARWCFQTLKKLWSSDGISESHLSDLVNLWIQVDQKVSEKKWECWDWLLKPPRERGMAYPPLALVARDALVVDEGEGVTLTEWGYAVLVTGSVFRPSLPQPHTQVTAILWHSG